MTSFGVRLAQERRRLGYRQGAFAALVGTTAPKQSLYENGHRELRAPYLARIAAAGVDVAYILTGKRSEGFSLGEELDTLLVTYRFLPPDLKESVMRFVEDMDRYVSRRSGRAQS
jgi:transcriptional regulator with XRE-family HTH domain